MGWQKQVKGGARGMLCREDGRFVTLRWSFPTSCLSRSSGLVACSAAEGSGEEFGASALAEVVDLLFTCVEWSPSESMAVTDTGTGAARLSEAGEQLSQLP